MVTVLNHFCPSLNEGRSKQTPINIGTFVIPAVWGSKESRLDVVNVCYEGRVDPLNLDPGVPGLPAKFLLAGCTDCTTALQGCYHGTTTTTGDTNNNDDCSKLGDEYKRTVW